MASSFKDHFSTQATDYARFRPDYPQVLFSWLAQNTLRRELAWDCATGSGQAAVALSDHFHKVVASDASAKQIENADRSRLNIDYQVFPAEQTPFADDSVDLITVAQALHWFDLPHFFQEVQRVLRPGGILAVWCYSLHRNTTAIDAMLDHFYTKVVGPYWPQERRMIETGYSDITLPFSEWSIPSFSMQTYWTLDQVMGYLGTWSATQRFERDKGYSPLPDLRVAMAGEWGEPDSARTLQWPLSVRVCQKPV